MKIYNITKLLLTLCACINATFAMAQYVTESDSLELVKLYNNNCGPDCSLKWGPDSLVSTWEGILINENNGNNGTIRDLDVSNKGLTGTIPNLILPDLGRIVLENNNLEGTIPDFNGVPRIYLLALSNNQLTGKIPNFSQLPLLEYIHLSDNQLSGTIPDFSNSPILKKLIFSSNELTGTIPDFSTLPELRSIYLNGNQLTGTIPNFSHLDSLEYLNLSKNQLNGEIPDLNNLSILKNISLTSNELTGNIPTFSTLTDLETIYLGDNQLTDTIPNFSNLTKLRKLYLQSNGLKGKIPDLDNHPALTHVILHQNELTGSIPEFTNSLGLKSLYFSTNQLSGTVPDFSNRLVNELYIKRNEFSYQDIATNFAVNHSSIPIYSYGSQYIGDRQFHTKMEEDLVELSPKPSIPYPNPVVGWIKEGDYSISPAVNNTTLTINPMSMDDIGIYKYYFEISQTPSSTSPPLTVEFTSRPIYVYIRGFDLSGAPVIPGELILDYGLGRPATEIDSLRNLFSGIDYGGTILDSCGCNVKVDLWHFPDAAMDMVRVDLGIDSGNEKRTTTADIDSGNEKRTTTADIDGGANRNAQQLTHAPGNGEQIAVSVSPLTSGNGSIIIGVLDTGLETTHPEVTANVWTNPDEAGNDEDQNCYTNDINGYNFVDANGGSGDIIDGHGHGTHVGGVIAANVPAGIDIKVMPVKTFDNQGNGTMYDMLCGIYYAVDNGADIINISAGYKGHEASVFKKTLQYGRENNVLFVVSAGNDSIDLDQEDYWPASFSRDTLLTNTMITVTSLDATYNLSDNVGYGDTTVTVAAQGEGVFSPDKDGGYSHFTGTSISTPLVALALGIEKTQNPDREYTTLRSDFLNSLNALPRLEGYVENGRVLTMGISNLTDIIINPEDLCVGTETGVTSFSIYGDIDFQVSTDVDWVEILSIQPGSNGTILTIEYDANDANNAISREATIIITAGNRTYKGYLIQQGTISDPIDLTINEAYINSDPIFKAASNITAAKVIGTDATVHYYAKNSIVMNDGFHAQPGSSFLASISTCEQPDNREELIPQISLKCYPNPFNAQTTIEYSLPEDSDITLIISDVAGRQVDVLINGETKTAGTHKAVFDGSQLPSGMYYYTIKTGDYFGTQKMILAK